MASHGFASSAEPLPRQSAERQEAVALVQVEVVATASATAAVAAASGCCWASSQRARGAAVRAAARRSAVFCLISLVCLVGSVLFELPRVQPGGGKRRN